MARFFIPLIPYLAAIAYRYLVISSVLLLVIPYRLIPPQHEEYSFISLFCVLLS